MKNYSQKYKEEFLDLHNNLLMLGLNDLAIKSFLEDVNKENFDSSLLIDKIKTIIKKEKADKKEKGEFPNNKNIKNLIGQKFGKLTVIMRVKNKSNTNRVCWLCECDCGREDRFVNVASNNLTSGAQKSCGCLKIGNSGAKPKLIRPSRADKRLYSIYSGMKQRCYNEKTESYKDYGGRGIVICEEWLDDKLGLKIFSDWALSNGYDDNLTIDRIDNDGNYEPNNCRWSTSKEQASNKRNTPFIEINGVEKSHAEWEREFNLPRNIIRQRISLGWEKEDLLRVSSGQKRKEYEKKGITFNKINNKWNVHVNGEYIGSYKDFEEAVKSKNDYLDSLTEDI